MNEETTVPAAARVGDLTAHGGTPLTPSAPGMGSPNVLIGGMPAWRAGSDIHVCPLANGPQPHVGGPVPVGSKSVYINNRPAVRQGDKVIDGGGANPITSGLLTVQIGG
jgi:uncharacterized Zn-binding protein involved in type VI secretion